MRLYNSLNDNQIKRLISRHYGINYTQLLENYIDVVRCVRNTSAHGGVLYDINLFPLIRRGPANVQGDDNHRLYGALQVIRYFLGQISVNRQKQFDDELTALFSPFASSPQLKKILNEVAGIKGFGI